MSSGIGRSETAHSAASKTATARKGASFAAASARFPVPSPQNISLAVGAFLIYLALLAPGMYSLDENSMLAVSEAVVARHSLAVPAGLGRVGPNGQIYSLWYPLQSVLAIPAAATGDLLARVAHLPSHYVVAIVALILPALYTALTLPFVVKIAEKLGSSNPGLAGIVYGFGTIAMTYARTFFADPLLALLAAIGVWAAFEGDGIWAAAACFLAILAKPAGIVLGPVLAGYLFLRGRRASLPLLGTAVGFIVYAAYNHLRFGNYLDFGQTFQFSVANVWAGFPGLLVSPWGGLLWFCPCTALAFWAAWKYRRSYEVLAIIALFFSLVGLHSLWVDWEGGWSWGPRLIVPALPGLVALSSLAPRRLFIAAGVLGFLISSPTLVTFYERYYAEVTERGIPYQSLEWSPAATPLIQIWPSAYHELRDSESTPVREMLQTPGASQTIANSHALRIVAVWWWMLPIIHVPWEFGMALSIVLIGLGIRLITL